MFAYLIVNDSTVSSICTAVTSAGKREKKEKEKDNKKIVIGMSKDM